MRAKVSIRNPYLWTLSAIAAVATAWVVARGQAADHLGLVKSPAGQETERNTGSIPNSSALSRKAARDSKAANSGSWVDIPVSWMKLSQAGLEWKGVHQVLGLTPEEAAVLRKKVEEVESAAAALQCKPFHEEIVLNEDESVAIPALSESTIRTLVTEVVATLPERCAPADHELASYLMERSLRDDFGRNLKVTVKYTQGISIRALRNTPAHLIGFNYVLEDVDRSETISSYGVNGAPFPFLHIHPSVTNIGKESSLR